MRTQHMSIKKSLCTRENRSQLHYLLIVYVIFSKLIWDPSFLICKHGDDNTNLTELQQAFI